MVLYRLCFINPNTGQIDREREIRANDDVDAVRVARESQHRPLEIWCGERRVRTFAASGVVPMHA